jgi:hypothetical protein
MQQSQHQMMLVRTYKTGVDEWLCPECGRRFLMRYPPNYKRIVIERGDEDAAHSGGTGGLSMGALRAIPADEVPGLSNEHEREADLPLDDEALRPWLKWLENPDSDEAA